MKISARAIIRGVVVGTLIVGLMACEKRETADNSQGPAERAGQQLDQATARAGEKLNEAAAKAGEGLQQLGQKLQNEAQEAQDSQKKE